jgi:hypothetical protein
MFEVFLTCRFFSYLAGYLDDMLASVDSKPPSVHLAFTYIRVLVTLKVIYDEAVSKRMLASLFRTRR